MKKIFSFLLLITLVVAACEPVQEELKPTLTVTTDEVIEIGAEGGVAEILYTVANGQDTKVNVSETAAWIDTATEESKIIVTVKANDSLDTRSAVITLRYYESTIKITVNQAAKDGEYDVEFKANRFEGIYFGMDYSDIPNYYVILSDIGTASDGTPKANGTYYFFDIYRNTDADEECPILPNGTYHFDAESSMSDYTFSNESFYVVTNAEGKVAKSEDYKKATVTVSDNHFAAEVELANGETHYVVFDGTLQVTIGHVISTFIDDVEFNVTDAKITAKHYGDTLNAGVNTWFIEAVKGDDYYCVELANNSSTSADGIYQMLEPDSKNYANTYIPGMIGEDGLLGTWYAKLTNNVIKGDVLAPMYEGIIRITSDGSVMTIEYGCKDDAGNNISGKVAGNVTYSNEQ